MFSKFPVVNMNYSWRQKNNFFFSKPAFPLRQQARSDSVADCDLPEGGNQSYPIVSPAPFS